MFSPPRSHHPKTSSDLDYYGDFYDDNEGSEGTAESDELRSDDLKTRGAKVVDPGQEHTGRWTREEHEAFLEALQQYGKEWKKVAARVKTRTGT